MERPGVEEARRGRPGDPRYLPTRLLCDVRYQPSRVVPIAIGLRACYAMSGTDVAYAVSAYALAMRCAVTKLEKRWLGTAYPYHPTHPPLSPYALLPSPYALPLSHYALATQCPIGVVLPGSIRFPFTTLYTASAKGRIEGVFEVLQCAYARSCTVLYVVLSHAVCGTVAH
eukprot:978884-Rhodomonas_salina.6